jgi:hypothetical protein
MTRRDFIMISAALRCTRPTTQSVGAEDKAEWDTWEKIVEQFASRLIHLPGFDRDLFLKKCGYKEAP